MIHGRVEHFVQHKLVGNVIKDFAMFLQQPGRVKEFRDRFTGYIISPVAFITNLCDIKFLDHFVEILCIESMTLANKYLLASSNTS